MRNFARIQRDSLRDVEVETLPGVVLGHTHIPLGAAGCYVPGGKYPLLASAHMSVITAKVAGVPRVVTCAPPFHGKPLRPPSSPRRRWPAPTRSTAWAASRRSPRWALGTQSIAPVDMLVGPGNAFVAEAKRQLFGRVGIDLFAGPTETLVIADEVGCDAELAATDLLGQAEHGPDSPAVLLTTSQAAGAGRRWPRSTACCTHPADRRDRRPQLGGVRRGHRLPTTTRRWWRIADDIASEHVQVMTRDPDYFLKRMTQLRRAVPRRPHQRRLRRQGDRHQPHAADAQGGALHRWAVGGQVHKDLHLPARADRRGKRHDGRILASRLCALEGFAGHAEQANVRVRRYGHRNVPYAGSVEPLAAVA